MIELRRTWRPAARRFATGARARGGRVPPALLAACLVCSLVTGVYFGGRAAVSRASAAPPGVNFLAAARQSNVDFSRFLHTSQRHASLACASCHERRDNSASPRLPGHKACTGCHLPQFVTPNIPMCAICHTSLDGQNPPVKNFPTLQSFNARFDHAQHDTGSARPAEGCAACHRPAGRRSAAMSIPAGLGAHSQCYACHTPGASAGGRDIGSCGACHQVGRFFRTAAASRSFVAFRHSTHGPRQGMGCNDCHQLRAGLPQSQQVTAPRFAQHFAAGGISCATCHNDRRRIGGRVVFGDARFDNCAKCHAGQTFRLGP
ncbi:MAG TPA: cytochrome c3 family protein [Pyrinomonadaceae bacterium]|nr:cytochrome c3 family protein [Pyrinomonadaceae bacterium]